MPFLVDPLVWDSINCKKGCDDAKNLHQNFARGASTIIPSFSENALSLQTDLERTSVQAAAMY